jgi:hypothetical protein
LYKEVKKNDPLILLINIANFVIAIMIKTGGVAGCGIFRHRYYLLLLGEWLDVAYFVIAIMIKAVGRVEGCDRSSPVKEIWKNGVSICPWVKRGEGWCCVMMLFRVFPFFGSTFWFKLLFKNKWLKDIPILTSY